MAGAVHVVGAGLAGLSCAVALAAAGRTVAVYEQAGQAGGRCRSFYDERLDRPIDNGNHLVLSGNTALHGYLRTIGALDRLAGPERASFSFVDLASQERWTIRPGAGRLPLWIFSKRRRIPGTRVRDYLAAWKIARAAPTATVAECLDSKSRLFRCFWEPLTVAVLNTAAEEAQAKLLWPVLRETFGRGEAACRPRIAMPGLGPCFVDPALVFLGARGARVQLHARLRSIAYAGDHAIRLDWADGQATELGSEDIVVLAVPPIAARGLLPDLVVPDESRAIVNAHFRSPRYFDAPEFVGLVGGLSQWIFVRDDVASVTVSAANGLAEEANETIAERLWPEIRLALGFADAPLPAHRIIKEKRATFAQTPAQAARRPGCRTRVRNLLLAGDWTDTGLPATLEGSVRSGNTAATSALAFATTT